ncbi:SDR family oxidoreductase [Actinoplanes sp. NBRC 103695]|uniref:SDR family NAD(P)-dependent oxidoreductase n=1 Tax=Actinoplanes sp. NBRC 103695 TaxID=3032202 RepID=UPI002553BE3C|nr:SDR family oxidoreductase [Actinoplanes sp. NBRC 103695]
MSTAVVIGGTAGLGRVIAQRRADQGDDVIVAGRDASRAEAVAKQIGDRATGLAVDLSKPHGIEEALAGVGAVDHLVITAIHQNPNTLANFDIDDAVTALTTKLVGYAEAVRVLRDRFTPAASVVLFGGLAKERPYPGSTVVTTFNGGLTGLVRTLAVEIAPHRVNAVHPALIGDSPKWQGIDLSMQVERTPLGRLVTMDEVAEAVDFLLRNGGMNAHDLYVDGGVLVR